MTETTPVAWVDPDPEANPYELVSDETVALARELAREVFGPGERSGAPRCLTPDRIGRQVIDLLRGREPEPEGCQKCGWDRQRCKLREFIRRDGGADRPHLPDGLDELPDALVIPISQVLHNLARGIASTGGDEAIREGESFYIFLLDRGHGLSHGLRVLACTERLAARPEKPWAGTAVRDARQLLAVFHDMESHRGRGEHMTRSGELLVRRLTGPLIEENLDSARLAALLMRLAGRRHSVRQRPLDDVEGLTPEERKALNYLGGAEVAQVQMDRARELIDSHFDADRLDETFDLRRLVYVNRCAGRVFFDPFLPLRTRLDVCTEVQGRVVRSRCGVRGTDTLTILLYSLTHNLIPESYRTERARDYVRGLANAREDLRAQLEGIIGDERVCRPGDAPRALAVVDRVLTSFDSLHGSGGGR